jgi:hypothetical protein
VHLEGVLLEVLFGLEDHEELIKGLGLKVEVRLYNS